MLLGPPLPTPQALQRQVPPPAKLVLTAGPLHLQLLLPKTLHTQVFAWWLCPALGASVSQISGSEVAPPTLPHCPLTAFHTLSYFVSQHLSPSGLLLFVLLWLLRPSENGHCEKKHLLSFVHH